MGYKAWVTHNWSLGPPPPGEHPLATLFQDAEGKPRTALTAVHSWPHSLNNLQQCTDYLEKLKVTVEDAFNEYFPESGPDKDKREMFQQCIAELDTAKGDLVTLHDTSCKAGLQVLKLHLSPMLAPLETLNYVIDEAQYNDVQVNDPFVKGFISQVQVIHMHLQAVLSPTSLETLMQHMAQQTCRRIENEALSKTFSSFGAMQFDREARALCSYFTNVSEQALRHRFARLLDMSSLLNVESIEEVREIYSDMKTLRLTNEEICKLVSSRVEFDTNPADLQLMLGS
eukprot:NODE_2123_length_989_cov_375.291221.p2 GENE.NODE_2123_length_989_cov_375.291221~~NODE_2123_length_989_cov_375.291221.p2  ORF type:complete len:285 (-),score=110.26 NODE_2123_length_989_cov_375.291221:117-971(-)